MKGYLIKFLENIIPIKVKKIIKLLKKGHEYCHI